MVGVGGQEHPATPVPLLPSVSDDGQAAHISGMDIPAGRCGEGVPVLCLYRELLSLFGNLTRTVEKLTDKVYDT